MSTPDPRQVFVVIPAYNEHASIHSVTQELLKHGYRLVIVDDGSKPSLAPVLNDLPVIYARHRVNLGQGAALQTGIEIALANEASFVVTFDADGQHEAGDIADAINLLVENQLDVVLGSRFLENPAKDMSAGRKRVLKMARYINFIFTGILLTDAHNGFRCMTAEAAGKITLKQNGMSHATEFLSIIRKQKLRYAEMPVSVYYTDYSKAKGQRSWHGFRILFDLLLSKFFK